MNIFQVVHNESIEYLETVCFLRIQSWDGTQSLKKIPRVKSLDQETKPNCVFKCSKIRRMCQR